MCKLSSKEKLTTARVGRLPVLAFKLLNVARNSNSFLPNSASMKNEVGYYVTPGYSTFAALDSILYPKSYKMTARRACNSNIGRVVTCLSIKTIPAFQLD